jgi:RNA polymerase sigma-70 factor (ECF subfamily)
MVENDWDQLVETLGPRLYRYFGFKGAREVASDLTQEVFLRLFVKIEKYDPSQGPLIAFSMGIAHNVWLESRRNRRDHEDINDHHLVSDNDPYLHQEKKDQAEKLKTLMRDLSQVQQDTLYFYFDEELTTKQIGDILGIPEGTVKSHLYRAKEFLCEKIQKEWT